MTFDCILYNGEKDLLDIRLHETCLCDDFVQTVIVEGDRTHTGIKKEPLFRQHKEWFKKFNIMYLIAELPENGTAIQREALQRNSIIKALNFLSPKEGDTVIISDVDEIPCAKQVNKFKADMQFASLLMSKYAYYLNWLESENSWDRARIMTWGYLKNKMPEEVRNKGYDFSINHAGRHFSWVIDPVGKLQSFSHTELDTPENIERVKRKENIWNEDKFKIVDIDLSYPEHLFKNQDQFAHLICKEL